MEFKEEELRGFKFNLSLEIQNLIIDMLVKKQILEEGNLEADKKELLEKEMIELRKKFVVEFRKSNKKKIKEFLKLLDK
jgi:hypothetical protein